jgi:hypothetical protein
MPHVTSIRFLNTSKQLGAVEIDVLSRFDAFGPRRPDSALLLHLAEKRRAYAKVAMACNGVAKIIRLDTNRVRGGSYLCAFA